MSNHKTASEGEVAVAAFHIWEHEGRPDGMAEEHWHRARAMLEARETFDGAGAATRSAARSAPAANGAEPPRRGRAPAKPAAAKARPKDGGAGAKA